MNRIDVLVVGAGPTGLMMAAELARHGLSCRIIDKGTGPSVHSKALAVQARTLEIMAHLGLSDLFLKSGLPVRMMHPESGGKALARIDFSSLDSPFPFILSLEQSRTEEILIGHLKSFGKEVEREVEIRSFRQTKSGVSATLLHHKTGIEEQIQASWLIGADGAHSLVRKELGIHFKGKSLSGHFSLADVRIDWTRAYNEAYMFLNSKGVLAMIPIKGKQRYRLIFQSEQFSRDPNFEEVEQIVKSYCEAGTKVSDPVWMASFKVNSRMSSNYRKGRVFLAGDAAHIHSPVGGQGMNTGIQDAFNLAWKIALVQRGSAPSALLDTYERERGANAKKLLKATEMATYFATLKNRVAIALRNFALSHLAKSAAFRKKVVEALSQTAIRTPSSRIAMDSPSFTSGPKAGMRIVSDFGERSAAHQLLLFSGANPTHKTIVDLAAIACRIASGSPFPIEPHLIVQGSDLPQLSAVPCHLDEDGSLHEIFGAKKSAGYIIRPDLVVGCRCMPLTEKILGEYLNFS